MLLFTGDDMRRSDREITDKTAVETFIAGQQIIRIGFYDGGVYIVPVNYGYHIENGRYIFYFHGAAAGRKYELAKSSPAVGFEIDGGYRLIEADTACDYSAEFCSVIGTGTLSLVTAPEEKLFGLKCLMKQTAPDKELPFDAEAVKHTAVFRLDATEMTCKAKSLHR